jgi:hypothetical protein
MSIYKIQFVFSIQRLGFISILGLASAMGFVLSCSSSGSIERRKLSKQQLPLYSTALSLRGRSREKVIEVLGEPADQPQTGRAFWFLSDESTYHPDPTPILYEFHFSEKGVLETVKKGVQK